MAVQNKIETSQLNSIGGTGAVVALDGIDFDLGYNVLTLGNDSLRAYSFVAGNIYFELMNGNLFITDAENIRFTFGRTTGNFTATGSITSNNMYPTTTNTGNIGNASNIWSAGYFQNATVTDTLVFNTTADAELFHDTSHAYIDVNTGNLYIRQGTTAKFTFSTSDGHFTAAGDVTAFSDARLKKDIIPIKGALDMVTNMNGVYYHRIDQDDDKTHIGVIAQDVEHVVPQVVHTNEEGVKSVAYGNMVAVLIEAIKEQQKQIDSLKALIGR